jgi:hypothetical protein
MSQIIKNNSGGGGSGITTINGDTGSITGSTVTIYADNATLNAGQSVFFDNSGTVSTLNVTDTENNTIIGKNSGKLGQTYNSNTFFGANGLPDLTSGNDNCGGGYETFLSLTTGPANTAWGTGVFPELLTGGYNFGAGFGAGGSYSGAESSNILIMNQGVNGESNVMRLGSQGSGNGEVDECFIAGIIGNTITSSPMMVTVQTASGPSQGQLGVAAIPSGFTPTNFQAYLTSNQTVAGGSSSATVIFDTAIANVGGAYNISTGVFTAPATGSYSFSTTVNFGNLTTPVGLSQVILAYTGNVQSLRLEQFGLVPATTGAALICSASWSMPMAMGDTVQIQPFADGTGNYIIEGAALSSSSFNTASTFSGFRIA